jgi:hypothetical protein
MPSKLPNVPTGVKSHPTYDKQKMCLKIVRCPCIHWGKNASLPSLRVIGLKEMILAKEKKPQKTKKTKKRTKKPWSIHCH